MHFYFYLIQVIRQSNSKVMYFVLWSIPVILFITFSMTIFMNHLLDSYEHYVMKAYLGNEGRLSVESDERLLNAIHLRAEKEGWLHSRLYDMRITLSFLKEETVITKNVELIVLEDKYFIKKFEGADKNTVIYNSVLDKSFGQYNINEFTTLRAVDYNNTVELSRYNEMKTGFLTDAPKLFMAKSLAEHLVALDKKPYMKIEFLETDDAVLKSIRKNIGKLAKEQHTMKIRFYDLVHDNEKFAQVMQRIRYIGMMILGMLLTFAAAAILVSIEILIYFKQGSLKTLYYLGISSHDLGMMLSLIVGVIIFIVIGAAFSVQPLLQLFYLDYTDLQNGFFIVQPASNVIFSVLVFLGSIVLTYVWCKRMILKYLKVM